MKSWLRNIYYLNSSEFLFQVVSSHLTGDSILSSALNDGFWFFKIISFKPILIWACVSERSSGKAESRKLETWKSN